jgi:hypothetical protein
VPDWPTHEQQRALIARGNDLLFWLEEHAESTRAGDMAGAGAACGNVIGCIRDIERIINPRRLAYDDLAWWSPTPPLFPYTLTHAEHAGYGRFRGAFLGWLKRSGLERFVGSDAPVWGIEGHPTITGEERKMIRNALNMLARAPENTPAPPSQLPGPHDPSADPPGRWLRVQDAAKAAGVTESMISRAVTSGELKGNGEERKKRRVCAIDLVRWQKERADKPEPVESAESVQRKLKRTDLPTTPRRKSRP